MIVAKDDFCGRAQEIRQLKSYIKSKNRCYLYGERRVGKTSLVLETARRLKFKCLTIDMLGVKTEDDVCRRLIKGIISFQQAKPSGLFDLLKQFAGLRPQLGIDPLTGLPTVGLAPVPRLTLNDIESAFEVLKSYKNTVIFFDEFQDILELNDSDNVLAVMRSKIQFLTDVSFVYAGSLRNAMLDIFTLDSSPFFKSAFPLFVATIEESVILKFLEDKFSNNQRTVDVSVLHSVYRLCSGVPGDIQRLCACLWDITDSGDEIDSTILPEALKSIFAMEAPAYERILHDVSAQQLKTVLALAQIGGESNISQELVMQTGITLVCSVRKAMKGLLEKRVVCFVNNTYKISNPFFGCWLLTKNI
jgi:hypothetical protein